MSFNWKNYTHNNPLLKEYISDRDFDNADNDELDALEKAGLLNPSDAPLGPEELEEGGTPISDFVDAVVVAREHMTRDEMIRQVKQNTDPSGEDLDETKIHYHHNQVQDDSTASTKIAEEVDLGQAMGDHLDGLRHELGSMHAMASQMRDGEWLRALGAIGVKLDALETAILDANKRLGVLGELDEKGNSNQAKISMLLKKRAEIEKDMEEEAEIEGGEVADTYGDILNKIDSQIAKLRGHGEWGPETNPYMDRDEIRRRAAMIKELEEGGYSDDWYINVSVKDAKKALETLRDEFGREYKNGIISLDGTNGYVINDRDIAIDLYDALKLADIEIIDTDVEVDESDWDDWNDDEDAELEFEGKNKGLWHNIRAKRARGEKPSHPNSKAFKSAVKAAKEINKGK